MSNRSINGVDRIIDTEKALDNVLQLAAELETERMADVKPWMVARLIRVAVADDLAAGFTPETVEVES